MSYISTPKRNMFCWCGTHSQDLQLKKWQKSLEKEYISGYDSRWLHPQHSAIRCVSKQPFKSFCWSKWVEWLQESFPSNSHAGEKIKTASKQQVLNWIVQANKELNSKKDLVSKSFKVCGISNGQERKPLYPLHKGAWPVKNIWIGDWRRGECCRQVCKGSFSQLKRDWQ